MIAGLYQMIPKLTFKRSMKAMAQAYVAAKKPVMEELGRYWHTVLRPKHFEATAVNRYGYQPRFKDYQIAKGRVKGHNRPLVWSGRTEKASETYTMIANKRSVRVRMQFPAISMRRDGKEITVPYISLRGRLGSGPDKKKELKSFTRDELEILQERAADMLTLAMAKSSGDPQINAIADIGG